MGARVGLRTDSRNLRRVERGINLLGLVAIAVHFLSLLPIDILSTIPATGGDTGSHLWPLYTLANWGVPNGTFRIWNPGNLCGEPHHLHYFPVPYFVMYLLSIVLPLGTAFNMGTLIPALLLPTAVFFSLRTLKLRFPAPLFGAAASTIFIYNESYSMWGGNLLSLLAGQFTHAFAFLPFLLGYSLLMASVVHKRVPAAASILFALVVGSHGYLMLGIPWLALACLLFARGPNAAERIRLLLLTAVLTGLLSLWYLVPMLLNQPWTTPFPQVWRSPHIIAEVFPLTFYPSVAVLLLYGFVAMRRRRAIERHERRMIGSLCFVALGYCSYYFVFPQLGLVDVRAFPQSHALLTIASGAALGALLRSAGRTTTLTITPLVFAAILAWGTRPIRSAAEWLQWNYSGWESKDLWPELKEVYADLRGDFNDGRVAYENNPDYETAGTMRVFEMLPYFTGRATLESVYLQASVVAPEIFYLQALISVRPSCPFMGYECKGWNLAEAEPHLRLLGVTELILSSPQLLAEAAAAPFVRKRQQFPSMATFSLVPPPPLVETFRVPPQLVDSTNWQRRFYDWFATLTRETPLLVVQNEYLPSALATSLRNAPEKLPWIGTERCEPKVRVQYNRIELETPCPGQAHLLKFSFHPAWSSSSGDPLFLVSPGFLGIIPSEKRVVLTFGGMWAWRLSDGATLITLIGVLFWSARTRRIGIRK